MPILSASPPSSLPPSGTAAGVLSGTYPNPGFNAADVDAATLQLVANVLSVKSGGVGSTQLAAGAAAANLGAAGGALTGTFPSPTLAWAYRNLLTGTSATIDTGANGIAQTGDLLEVIVYLRTDEVAALSLINILVNADSSALYDFNFAGTSNVSFTAGITFAATAWTMQVPAASAAAGSYGMARFVFPFYSQTTGWKEGTMSTEIILDTTAANTRARFRGLQYRSTNAISRISFTPATGGVNLIAGSGVLATIR